jgi:hypothetical protein
VPRSPRHLPGRHPLPPADLGRLRLPLDVLGPRERWWRIHDANFAALFFGKTRRYRFDDPLRQYGVLYVGRNVRCAFVETLGAGVTDRRRPLRRVSLKDLEHRALACVRALRPLRLVDLRDRGLQALGADGRLTTGDYRIAQEWSRALWEHPEQPDGILFRSRHDPSKICAALFERCASAVVARGLGRLVDLPAATRIADAIDWYGYSVDP